MRLLSPKGPKDAGLKAGDTEGTARVDSGSDLHVWSRRGDWLKGTSKKRPKGCAKETLGTFPKISVFSCFLHFALLF